MKFPKFIKNDTNLFIDECKETLCLPDNNHSSISFHQTRQEHKPCSSDMKTLSPSEYLYTQIVKAIGNNEFMEEKHLLKRASWSPNEKITYGLPPTGKQNNVEQSKLNKVSNRVRMRSKPKRNSQVEQLNRTSLHGPILFNEKDDQCLLDKFINQATNHSGSLSNERYKLSPTPSSSSSIDSIFLSRTRSSSSFDNNDLANDISTASSLNTITSLTSILSSKKESPIREHICSPKSCLLLSEYQQKNLDHIDYKILSPILNKNTVTPTSPISSLSSSSSPSSPLESSLNQYADFTLQTPSTNSFLDVDTHPQTMTTHRIMNMSMSPNRYHNQTYSSNPILTSMSTMTNNNDGLKQQREQTKSKIAGGSCLKSNKLPNNNSNQTKKSVHFGWHSPKEIRSLSPSTNCNYRPSVTVTSSSLSIAGNRNGDNNIQAKKTYSEKVEEKEKIETTRRTNIASSPLSTNKIHRSCSLSPSPFLKEENSDSRRHRQEKKKNVGQLNYTTSGRVTTAATHFHCNTNTAIVTFNDGNQNISSEKDPNGTNSLNSNENLTNSSTNKQMPLNTLHDKTSTRNSQGTTMKKSFIGNGGFFSFINRSNMNNNNLLSTNENKQLKRTSSTQQKSKQYKTHANKRFSADIDTLGSPSISSYNTSKGDIDKVTMNYREERQSTTDNNTNSRVSSNTNSSIPLCTNTKMNRSSTPMSMNPTTITVKSDEGDSLNNGLLFQPVHSIEREPFFLSPSKSLPNNDESSSSVNKIQTSTLIIANPAQYHYYLYPPPLASSSTSSASPSSSFSSSTSKMNLPKNRSISNVSMNSVSTNSSSSNTSYESQTHDLDDDTLSYPIYSINKPKKVHFIKSISNTKPLILSDSVQAFWPPPTTLKNIPEQTLMASTVIQSKYSNSINHNHKQTESNSIQNNVISSTAYNDDSSSIVIGSNQIDVLTPTTSSSSVLLNNKQEVRSYSEQNSFTNECLHIARNSSLEDTQASYSERLRETSRFIKTTNQLLAMNIYNSNNSLFRSRSKDTIEANMENSIPSNKNILRPKSVNQVRVQALLSPSRTEMLDDFQSKRQFFENRTYTDYPQTLTNNKTSSTLLPSNTTKNNNNGQNHVATEQVSSDSMIRTTKYFDTFSNRTPAPATIYRKPVRVVKAVQRSAQALSTSASKITIPIKMNSTNESNIKKEQHRSSDYIRNLFPIPDHLKRHHSRQNPTNNNINDIQKLFTNTVRQTEDALFNLRKTLEILQENQKIINDETEINTILGTKLINLLESKAELNEIEKVKLHINEIDTITSILLKLSCRLAKTENDLMMITEDDAPMKSSLLERREKILQKYEEAKTLKDGIDRRSRLIANILRKYFSDEQYDDYDHFIRMKSTLLIDAKDIEENISFIQKQIEILLSTPSSSSSLSAVNNQQYSSTSSISLFENLQRSNSLSSLNKTDSLKTNYFNPILTTA